MDAKTNGATAGGGRTPDGATMVGQLPLAELLHFPY